MKRNTVTPKTNSTKTSTPLVRKGLLAFLAVLIGAATILVLPPDAEAQVATDEVTVTALDNGTFELDYQLSYSGTFEDIRYFEVVGSNGSWLIYRNNTELMFGANFSASVVMQTPLAYGDARQHCFKVRSHDRFGNVSPFSMNGCATAATYEAPANLSVKANSRQGGSGHLTWSDPDLITMGSVLVEPDYIQIYDGRTYRWVNLTYVPNQEITHNESDSTGRWTCYITRYWTQGLGVSGWSNWTCTVLN